LAHCPYELVADLEPVFDEMRTWPGIKEKSPGVFYVKSIPFLHFHVKDGERWADVKADKTWGEPVDIPMRSTKVARDRFAKEVRRRYELVVQAKS